MATGIIPNDKRFDVVEHAKCDPIAKQVASEWLVQDGYEDIKENLSESNGKFDRIWDVSGQRSDWDRKRVEAEVKKDWGVEWFNIPFMYTTIHFPYRKRNKAREHATHMMIVGGDQRRLFVVERQVMLESPVEEKWVRNRKQYEPFFYVDIYAPTSEFWFKNASGVWQIHDETTPIWDLWEGI